MSDKREEIILFSFVPRTLVLAMWPLVSPHLQKVVDVAPMELTLEGIQDKALKGELELLCVTKGSKILAVSTLEVRTFDTGLKALTLPILGGDELLEWLPEGLKFIRELAKNLGCSQIRGYGARPGWLKILSDQGWEKIHEIIGLEINL